VSRNPTFRPQRSYLIRLMPALFVFLSVTTENFQRFQDNMAQVSVLLSFFRIYVMSL
jgi:hypothetical protein